jgi:hypothetical protein
MSISDSYRKAFMFSWLMPHKAYKSRPFLVALAEFTV